MSKNINQPIKIRKLSRQLRLGEIFYKLYHSPKGLIGRCRNRGFINYLIDYKERTKMEAALLDVPTIRISKSELPLEIYFLTGEKFWYQSCFCVYSFIKYSEEKIQPCFYDDGTLKTKLVKEIKRIFPNAVVVLIEEIENKLDKYLPFSKYPKLRELRLTYPNIKKLTDIHAGSQGWKLVLDSDMLFFKKPDLIINWLKKTESPFHLIDIENSYGYSNDLMTSLIGNKIPSNINVGVLGFKSDNIDWDQLEHWCDRMLEEEGKHYYLEQAIIAMMLSDVKCVVAPMEDYLVMPDKNEVISPKAVMHHYVADSKPWYFRYGWKHVV